MFLLYPISILNIESCNKKLNKKIELANEDHCGPCGDKRNIYIKKYKYSR